MQEAQTHGTGMGPPGMRADAGSEVRVRLPTQLRELAGVGAEVQVEVGGPVTQRSVLDALESRYPVLKGTVRDRATAKRRPFIRFFVGEEDSSQCRPR